MGLTLHYFHLKVTHMMGFEANLHLKLVKQTNNLGTGNVAQGLSVAI